MKIDTPRFEEKSRAALADPELRRAMETMQANFSGARGAAVAGLPEFDALRDRARAVKDRTLAHLDHYLEAWESAAAAAGVRVHRARKRLAPARPAAYVRCPTDTCSLGPPRRREARGRAKRAARRRNARWRR